MRTWRVELEHAARGKRLQVDGPLVQDALEAVAKRGMVTLGQLAMTLGFGGETWTARAVRTVVACLKKASYVRTVVVMDRKRKKERRLVKITEKGKSAAEESNLDVRTKSSGALNEPLS